MSAVPRRRCPVCWGLVRKTSHAAIEGHWDSIGRDVCPSTGEPYDITVAVRRVYTSPPRRRPAVTATRRHLKVVPAA